MIGKNAKRLLLVLSLALLLPGTAGAAGFGAAEPSFWEESAAIFSRFWESWTGLTGLWTSGGSIDPHGGAGTNGDGGGSIDPNGGLNGAGACTAGDCGITVDPNG